MQIVCHRKNFRKCKKKTENERVSNSFISKYMYRTRILMCILATNMFFFVLLIRSHILGWFLVSFFFFLISLCLFGSWWVLVTNIIMSRDSFSISPSLSTAVVVQSRCCSFFSSYFSALLKIHFVNPKHNKSNCFAMLFGFFSFFFHSRLHTQII